MSSVLWRLLGLWGLKSERWRGGCSTLAARCGGANNISTFTVCGALVLIVGLSSLIVLGSSSALSLPFSLAAAGAASRQELVVVTCSKGRGRRVARRSARSRAAARRRRQRNRTASSAACRRLLKKGFSHSHVQKVSKE
jgi:hypothetical protein